MKDLSLSKIVLLAASCLTLVATSAQAIPLVNGGVVTLSQSATVITINGGSGSQKVQRLTVRIIPGFACKAYVGAVGHVRATYAGVYAVLYPNATGGWSEEFTIEDPRGTDGIDLSTIALSGDCAGEQVNLLYYQTGTTASTNFRIFRAGPISPPAGQNTAFWGGSTTLAALVRVQVIPGYSGKFRLKGQQQLEIAQLFPNTGNTAQHSAHSERLQIVDRNGQLRPDMMYMSVDVAGEQALVLLATYN